MFRSNSEQLLLLCFEFLCGNNALVQELLIFPDGLGVADLGVLGRFLRDHGRRLRRKVAALASAAGAGGDIGRIDLAAGALPAAGGQKLLIMGEIHGRPVPPGSGIGAVARSIVAGGALGNVLLCLSVLRHMAAVGRAAVDILGAFLPQDPQGDIVENVELDIPVFIAPVAQMSCI